MSKKKDADDQVKTPGRWERFVYEAAIAKPSSKRDFFEMRAIKKYEEKYNIHASQPETGGLEVQVVEYKDQADMEWGISQMLAQGWQVSGQSAYTPKKSLTRTVAGGLLFFNPKPVTTVTYTRTPAPIVHVVTQPTTEPVPAAQPTDEQTAEPAASDWTTLGAH